MSEAPKMTSPATSNERWDFFSHLEGQLKPVDFWVTDLLTQRLWGVRMTFCAGESANEETIRCCAKYCEEILRLEKSGLKDLHECLEQTALPDATKAGLAALLELGTSSDLGLATTEQAYSAVSAFLHLVFTRNTTA